MTLRPLRVGLAASNFQRADIVVSGLEQAGPSYELRIFLNNPDADAGTEPNDDHGYAGSIYVYGYGQPPPGMGQPDGQPGARPRIPMTRSVNATEAVRAAMAHGPDVSVTLVPVSYEDTDLDIDLDGVEVTIPVDQPPLALG